MVKGFELNGRIDLSNAAEVRELEYWPHLAQVVDNQQARIPQRRQSVHATEDGTEKRRERERERERERKKGGEKKERKNVHTLPHRR